MAKASKSKGSKSKGKTTTKSPAMGQHRMSGGMMMSDSEMDKMHSAKKK